MRTKALRTIGRNAIALIAAVVFCGPAFALTPVSGSDAQTLSRIEMHFFERSYTQASEDARLSRIELLVFGQKSSGSNSQRLQRLVKALPAEDIADSTAAAAPAVPAKQPQKTPTIADAHARPLPATDYPSIDALEKQVLGTVYKRQPVGERLARLEKREFGTASNEHDLSKRVDRLTNAVQAKNSDETAEAGSIVPFTNNSGWEDENQPTAPTRTAHAYGGDEGYQPATSYGHNNSPAAFNEAGIVNTVSSLEKTVFGKPQKHQPLPDRVTALENKIFGPGGAPSGGSLMERTDRLAQALNGNGTRTSSNFSGSSYSPAVASEPTQGFAYPTRSPKTDNGHPVLRKIGRGALIAGAIAGVAALDILGGLGSSNMGYGGMGYGGMGYSAPMGMGMGYGMAPTGMGYGMGMRPFGF